MRPVDVASVLLGALAIQNTRPRVRPLAKALEQEYSFADGDFKIVAEVDSDDVEFTVTADKSGFSGFVFIGFAHASDHSDSVVYDGFVGGVKDGEAYGASYVYQDGTLTRVPEERFQLVSGSESGGRTTLTLRRDMSLCFWESFDWRDVGDAVLFSYTMAEEDLEEVDPMPEEIDVDSVGEVLGEVKHMTLFTKSMAPSDDLEDDFDAVDLVFDGRDPDGSMSMCTIKKSDEEFDYFVGFNPVLEPEDAEDKIRLMMLYQCNNLEIEDQGDGDTPSLTMTSEDGCRTGNGPIENMYKLCQDVLYVYSPGDEGEELPGSYGITANEADSHGDRYFMLMVVYDDRYDNTFYDESGVRAFVDSGSDYEAASKLVVGHHMSSKMIVLPSEEWVVQGICPSTCTGLVGITDEDEVDVVAGSIHYGENAARARLLVSGPADDDDDVDVYHNLITDDPPIHGFVPSNRDLSHLGVSLELAITDVVVECTYASDHLLSGDVANEERSEFCFGTLTLSPPLALSTCTSVPTEEDLALAMDTELSDYLDVDEKKRKRRRRKKRQSKAILDGFYERSVDEDSLDTVGEVLEEMAEEAAGDQDTADSYNGVFLLAEMLPLCVESNGDVASLDTTEVAQLGDAESAPEVTEAECQELKVFDTEDPDPRPVEDEEEEEEDEKKSGSTATAACQMLVLMMMLIAMTNLA